MDIKIDNKGFEMLLRMLLSCRCPLKDEIENKLVSLYYSKKNEEYIDYNSLISLGDEQLQLDECKQKSTDTVFHRLKEFCLYSINDLDKEIIITEEDVYRHFCTNFHWRHVERYFLKNFDKIENLSSWFVGHMLLPITLKHEDNSVIGEYSFFDRKIILRNIYISPNIPIEMNGYYCIHFAAIISKVNEDQFNMIFKHLEENKLFKQYRQDLKIIDYKNYQRFGNYYEIVKNRYKKFETHELLV